VVSLSGRENSFLRRVGFFIVRGLASPSPVSSVVIPERVCSANDVEEERDCGLAGTVMKSGATMRPLASISRGMGFRASRDCGSRSRDGDVQPRTKDYQ